MSKPYHPIDYAITSKGLKRLSDQESLQPISDALRAYIPITNVERHRYVEPIWHVDRGKVKKLIDTSQIVRVAGGLADKVLDEFEKGIGKKSISASEFIHIYYNQPPIVWGTLRGTMIVMSIAKENKSEYIYIDHAYFNHGHNSGNYRICISARKAPYVRRFFGDRFKQSGLRLQDWKKGGEVIVVCPPSDYSLRLDLQENWLSKTLADLRLRTKRKIVVKTKDISLSEYADTAHAVVTLSSNVAVDAYLLGIPVICTERNLLSFAGSHNIDYIDDPIRGDRETLMNWLAYNQFSRQEIMNGEAFQILADLYG